MSVRLCLLESTSSQYKFTDEGKGSQSVTQNECVECALKMIKSQHHLSIAHLKRHNDLGQYHYLFAICDFLLNWKTRKRITILRVSCPSPFSFKACCSVLTSVRITSSIHNAIRPASMKCCIPLLIRERKGAPGLTRECIKSLQDYDQLKYIEELSTSEYHEEMECVNLLQ